MEEGIDGQNLVDAYELVAWKQALLTNPNAKKITRRSRLNGMKKRLARRRKISDSESDAEDVAISPKSESKNGNVRRSARISGP